MPQIYANVDANRADEETYRIDRLNNVVTYIRGRLYNPHEHHETPIFLFLYDHKGTLHATAVADMSVKQAKELAELIAWTWEFEENEPVYSDIVVLKPIPADPYEKPAELIPLYVLSGDG